MTPRLYTDCTHMYHAKNDIGNGNSRNSNGQKKREDSS